MSTESERWLNTKQAAEYLGCSEMSLAGGRTRKTCINQDKPTFYYVGGGEKPRVLYKQSDLDAFLARKAAKKESSRAKQEQKKQEIAISKQKRRALREEGKRASKYGGHLYAQAKDMVEHDAFAIVPFKPRDRAVLVLLAQGYALWAVSDMLGLSLEGARQVYLRACRKFNTTLTRKDS